MAYQNLFEALQNVCGFTALESDMFEIINAYEKDKAEQDAYKRSIDDKGRSIELDISFLDYNIKN